MKKNLISNFTNKPFNLRLFAGLFAVALLATTGLFLWQTSASMQNSITSNDVGFDSGDATVNVVNPSPDAPCSTTAFSTTLRFPGAGVTENQLYSFDVATPGTLTLDVPVGGLNTAISEYLASVDFRPATGELFGLVVQNNGAATGTIRIVTVNTTTGMTTPVGAPITVPNPGNFNGFDFNPVVDRIRVTRLGATGARDFNLRINPNDATVTTDTPLAYAVGDPNAGADEFIVGGAYTNNIAGATSTTLFGIDSGLDRLVRQGSVGGTPDSPNGGLLFTIGDLGVNTSGLVGFDIVSDNAAPTNTAYAILDTVLGTGAFGAPGRLYTINLTTGAATLVAPIGGLATRFSTGLAIRTCPGTVPVITSTGPSITAESCTPANMQPDPNETITVSLPLQNVGGAATANLTATLAATGGVTNPNPASQNYGVLAPNATASRNFTFVVDPNLVCGTNVVLTFTITDGATNLGTVTRTFTTGIRTVTSTQNFDGVTAPALPTGWTSVQTSGTAINWVTSTTTPSSAPNAAFANDPATVNAAALVSPAVAISSAAAQITFRNSYVTETNFDGMVLEYSTNGGTTWTDVITGGGTFAAGGYNGTLSAAFMNPIGGRMAWTGNSNGYVTSTVNLPASLNGQMVNFRWLMGSDSSVAGTGVRVDDVQILGALACASCGPTCNIQRRNDFNGDGRTDFSVFRPSANTWFIQNNGSSTFTGTNFGVATDRLQPFDYDGDGRTDIGVYRAGTWFWLQSSDNVARGLQFGAATDIPVIGDYVGDSRADLTVYRPSTGVWYTRDGNTGAITAVQWGGNATDVPAPGDYNGDCKYDYAVRRTVDMPAPSDTQFFILQSGGTATSVRWGNSSMQMAIGDYNGDGRSDVGVVANRGGTALWYVISVGGPVLVNGTAFGLFTDIVVPGDYDGDRTTDLAYFRPSNGIFFYRNSMSGTTGTTAFGTNGDIPTARAYQHPLP